MIAVTFIILVCLMMLAVNRDIFALPSKPLSAGAFYSTEIDGCINYIESDGGKDCFSVREEANQLFKGALNPLSANPHSDFFSNATVGDFIHKPGDSDTVILIKNSERYYYSIGR